MNENQRPKRRGRPPKTLPAQNAAPTQGNHLRGEEFGGGQNQNVPRETNPSAPAQQNRGAQPQNGAINSNVPRETNSQNSGANNVSRETSQPASAPSSANRPSNNSSAPSGASAPSGSSAPSGAQGGDTPPKRGRGRPRGSKNKPKTPPQSANAQNGSNGQNNQNVSRETNPNAQTNVPRGTTASPARSAANTNPPKRRGRPPKSQTAQQNNSTAPNGANVSRETSSAPAPKQSGSNTQNGAANSNVSRGTSSSTAPKRTYTTIPVQAYHAGGRRVTNGAATPRPIAPAAHTTHSGTGKLRIIPLGGLMEIGKNVTLYEFGDDIIMVDCGMSFPEDDMPGVDVVMPDLSYLFANKTRVRGCFITHGHEDHIGAISYMLREMSVPVYATPFARGLIEGKLEEANLLSSANLITIHAGEHVRAGCFEVEAINVNHSTPDSVAYAITTPVGVVIQTGDFKIDSTPVAGGMIDLGRFAEYGRDGVLALLSDSTNVERQGYTMSERTVGETFDRLFTGCNQRIIVTTFASNVHRIQQIAEAAVKVGRKVAISGRSMEKVMDLAVKMGYIDLPAGTLVDINNIHSITPSKLVIVTTGSQGETLSALARMAAGSHKQVSVGANDKVIISASSIPGNESSIAHVINELMRRGADVVYESLHALHVSGHACQEELKIMIGLVKPKFFMPVHGEYKMLRAHAKLALQMGVDQKNIFIGENGRVLELTQTSARLAGSVPSGQVLLDGTLGNDVEGVVLRDRKVMSEDGVIIVAATVDYRNGEVLAGPQLISRGFAAKEGDPLMRALENIARDVCDEYSGSHDFGALRTVLRSRISDQVWKTSRRQPLVLPVLLEG